MSSLLTDRICIVGAGASGLITAHILIQDGYQRVEVLSRDSSPGGTWAATRVYPELVINNIHGEYSFSCLDMPPRAVASDDIRLSGLELQAYMEKFASTFLTGKIRYNAEVLKIRPRFRDAAQADGADSNGWTITVENTNNKVVEELEYDKVVLCTGGCSEPYTPVGLSEKEARLSGFQGPVVHSAEYSARTQELLDAVPQASEGGGTLLVIGGGKSASDIAAHMADKGRRVTMVFTTIDAAVASPFPLPSFISRSRFFSALSPHIELRTPLERFLHTTWAGAKLVHGFWDFYQWMAFKALGVPNDSPLRRAPKLFWSTHANNQGSGGALARFYHLANEGAINLIAPARVASFSHVAQGVVLSDGRVIQADAVVLGTGYASSWNKIFDDVALEELGLGSHTPSPATNHYRWDYTTLCNAPVAHPSNKLWTPSIYRGLVPARNILRRNLAINGAIFTPSCGYAYELSAHWIASYFRGDQFLRLPSSAEEALASAAYNGAWLRKRYPDIYMAANDSVRSDLALWCWPQIFDTLLEDMGLQILRGGGNVLTWPFKVVDVKEIAHLKEERDALRSNVV